MLPGDRLELKNSLSPYFLPYEYPSRHHPTGIPAHHSAIMPSSQAVSGDLAIKPEFVDQKSPMASTSEPNRNPKYDPKKPHITDMPITKANWYKHVNWLNVSFAASLIGNVLRANTAIRSSSSSASPSLAASLLSGLP